MKDTKTIIIITIIVGTILAVVTGFITYKITLNVKENKQEYLMIGNYSLQYGIYKGYNIEYEWDDRKEAMVESNKKQFILKLNSDNTYELNGEKHKFSIEELQFIVSNANSSMKFKAIGNNKIEYQVGSGIEMTYSGK